MIYFVNLIKSIDIVMATRADFMRFPMLRSSFAITNLEKERVKEKNKLELGWEHNGFLHA